MDIVDKVVCASGDMTQMYVAASSRYKFSDAIVSGYEPTKTERAQWLREVITALQVLQAAQLNVDNSVESAIQTRQLLGQYLDELGEVIESLKADGVL